MRDETTDADGPALVLAIVQGSVPSAIAHTAQALLDILAFLADRDQELEDYQVLLAARADEPPDEVTPQLATARATVQGLVQTIQAALAQVQAASRERS